MAIGISRRNMTAIDPAWLQQLHQVREIGDQHPHSDEPEVFSPLQAFIEVGRLDEPTRFAVAVEIIFQVGREATEVEDSQAGF